MAITKRQRQVYDFIHDFVQSNGYSPSFEEIGDGLGLSSLATVHKHISNLEKKGLLKRDYNRSRSIDVLPIRGLFKRQPPKELALPLMGRIAAGHPIEAVENPETISLGDITRSKDVFVLQVKGESMKDEHIVDGDYVLVEKTNNARVQPRAFLFFCRTHTGKRLNKADFAKGRWMKVLRALLKLPR